MKKYLVKGEEVVEKVKEAYSKIKNFTVFDAEKLYEMKEFINPCIYINDAFKLESGEQISAIPIKEYLDKDPNAAEDRVDKNSKVTMSEVAKHFREHSGSFKGYCVTVNEETYSFILMPHDKELISVVVCAPIKEFKENLSYKNYYFHHCLFPKNFEKYGNIVMFDKFFIPDEEAFTRYEKDIERIAGRYFDHHTNTRKVIYSPRYHKEIDSLFKSVPLA